MLPQPTMARRRRSMDALSLHRTGGQGNSSLSGSAQALGGELLAERAGEALVLLGRVVELRGDAKHALRRPPHDGHLDLPVVEEALLEGVAGTPARLDRGVRRQDHAGQRADHLLRASGGRARRRAEELARGQSEGAIARHESGPAAGDELAHVVDGLGYGEPCGGILRSRPVELEAEAGATGVLTGGSVADGERMDVGLAIAPHPEKGRALGRADPLVAV